LFENTNEVVPGCSWWDKEFELGSELAEQLEEEVEKENEKF
jgi:hypothetical protein